MNPILLVSDIQSSYTLVDHIYQHVRVGDTTTKGPIKEMMVLGNITSSTQQIHIAQSTLLNFNMSPISI